MDNVRLTQLVKAGGCGSKLGAGQIRELLDGLPRVESADVLFGLSSGDDAGAFRLTPDLAIIQTVDFFTPIVDDPYDFGAIAAANSLSDCYALGGRPVTALNILAAPRALGNDVIREILRGGADKALEAGTVVIGGHSVADAEPKYGMAVTGVAHPDRIIRNDRARPGDVLIITKKIGTGIVSNALKNKVAGIADEVVHECIESMKTLNAGASAAMIEHGASACTDVTGYGLLGHASNIARASGVSMEISYSAVPLFASAESIAVTCTKGGGERNREWVEKSVVLSPGVGPEHFAILADPQTSGPLLIAVPAERSAALLQSLRSGSAPHAAVIGKVTAGVAGSITVVS